MKVNSFYLNIFVVNRKKFNNNNKYKDKNKYLII